MNVPPKARYWLAIANDVRIETRHDNVVIVAAGVAFYAVLAILPALFLLLSIYGLFTDLDQAERQIDALLDVLPGSTMATLGGQMRSIAAASHASLNFGFAASVAALAWTVSNATRALVRAIKIAYDQETEQSILENRVVAIALSLGVIIALITSLAFIAAVPVILARFDPTHVIVTFGNLRWLLIGCGVLFGIGLLYRYAPPRRPQGWRSVMPGAVMATLLWTASSLGFSIYVSSFGNYNETYGTLGAAVVLLLWFWFTALAIILGAEFNEALIKRPDDGPSAVGDTS
jgi:membrane protein